MVDEKHEEIFIVILENSSLTFYPVNWLDSFIIMALFGLIATYNIKTIFILQASLKSSWENFNK
jgi:hypothetical protein